MECRVVPCGSQKRRPAGLQNASILGWFDRFRTVDLPEPQDLAAEAITELEAVVDELKDILQMMETNGRNGVGMS